MGIFSIDGPFSRTGTKVFDIILVFILWGVVNLLGLFITFGASTTALFYVMDKCIIHDRAYIIKNFFKSFKVNFVKATIIWIIMAALAGVGIFTLINLEAMEESLSYVKIIQYFVFIELLIIFIYIFPLLSKLDTSLKDLVTNAFFMSHKHLPITAIIVLTMVGSVYLSYKFVEHSLLISILGTVGWCFLSSKLIIGHVLAKYIPKEELEKFNY